MNRIKKEEMILISLLTLALIASIIVATMVGAVKIPLGFFVSLIGATFNGSGSPTLSGGPDYATIILKIRLARVFLALLVGAALSVSGVVYQGIFKNPMADPYVIGVSSGAALGATIAALLIKNQSFWGFSFITLFAFAFGVLAVFIVYRISKGSGRVSVETLLLAGVALGALFHAMTSFIMVFASRDLHFIIFWLMGGFSSKGWDHVLMLAFFSSLTLPYIYLHAFQLDLFLLGEERASQLGVDVERTKRSLIIAACLLSAAAVSASGIIGFVGLIVPHMLRLIVGPDHKMLILASALFGAVFLILCDLLARTVMAPTEVPLGIITALFGAPFFIYLLKRRKGY